MNGRRRREGHDDRRTRSMVSGKARFEQTAERHAGLSQFCGTPRAPNRRGAAASTRSMASGTSSTPQQLRQRLRRRPARRKAAVEQRDVPRPRPGVRRPPPAAGCSSATVRERPPARRKPSWAMPTAPKAADSGAPAAHGRSAGQHPRGRQVLHGVDQGGARFGRRRSSLPRTTSTSPSRRARMQPSRPGRVVPDAVREVVIDRWPRQATAAAPRRRSSGASLHSAPRPKTSPAAPSTPSAMQKSQNLGQRQGGGSGAHERRADSRSRKQGHPAPIKSAILHQPSIRPRGRSASPSPT